MSYTLSLYNIHTWNTISKFPHRPATCILNSTLSMAESEESYGRFQRLFDSSFVHYDGNSTTLPTSSVPRVYYGGKFKDNADLKLYKPYQDLIKAAVYVASTCHKGLKTSNREHIVSSIEKHFRVDSLGKCHHTSVGPEGVSLLDSENATERLNLKRKAISNYQFYLAFENTIEPGYVTEKVYDALLAGTVPVYLGDSSFCKKLIPLPNAVIYLDDFDGKVEQLVEKLKYLSTNETAYEEYRSVWRLIYPPATPLKPSSLLSLPKYTHLSHALEAKKNGKVLDFVIKSWPCRLCEWTLRNAEVAMKQRNNNEQQTCLPFQPKG